MEKIQKLFQREMNQNIVSTTLLTGDASLRKYYRIKTALDSYIFCLDESLDGIDKFIRVQKSFQANKVQVPEVFWSGAQDHAMILEDLGDITFLQNLLYLSLNQTESAYKNILDQQMKINTIKAKSEDFLNEDFHYEKLISEIRQTEKYYLRSFLKNTNNVIVDELMILLDDICKQLGTYKHKVMCHRDYHSRNIMVKNNHNYIIDFQDARLGLPQYDLVSLIDDCYIQLDETLKRKLKHYYWDNMSSKLSLGSYDEFNYWYQMMLIQRALKAIGSFTYISVHKQDNRYLKYIDSVMSKIFVGCDQFPKITSKLKEFYYAD